MAESEALTYAGTMVAMAGITAIINNHFYFQGFCNGNKMRAAICSLIYKKSLRLSQTALHDTSPGKFVNLLSNDVGRFQFVSYTMHSLWIAPLITVFAIYLLWQEIQWAAVLGSTMFFAVIPLQSEFRK